MKTRVLFWLVLMVLRYGDAGRRGEVEGFLEQASLAAGNVHVAYLMREFGHDARQRGLNWMQLARFAASMPLR